ncbi:MAG: hypothetical protein JKX70_07170 [Phycisphaerales bacterium]|nr:hypothetical protein [Phycisphaerales bacterium]
MKYIHPDIVVGEPVPEVEPKVNQEVLSAVRWLTRWGYWFFGVYLVMSILMAFVSIGFVTRIVVVVAGLAVWSVPHFVLRKHLTARGKDQWCIPFREELRYTMISTGIALTLMMPVLADNGIAWLIGLFGGVIFFVGINYLVMYFRACEPGQISCKKCSYALVGLTLPCECPECGTMVYGLPETTDRPRVSLPSFRWIGSGLSVVGLAIVLSLLFRPGVIYQQMPRSVLLGLAATDTPAFVELIASPMTNDERTQLIDRIIEANKDNGIWSRYSYEHEDWLEQCYKDGSMNDEQVARMLAPYEMEDMIMIDAPRNGRIGEPIKIQLLGQNIRTPGSAFRPGFFFRGFEIEDGEELHSGSGFARSLYRITKRGHKMDDTSREGRGRPEHVFTPTQAGHVVIRARIVLAKVRGRTLNTAIDWELPVGEAFGVQPIWYRVIDLEHTIEVQP